MRVRFFVFLFVFGLVCSPVFSATPKNSSSSQLGKPSVKFQAWQMGRSPKNTDTNSANHNATSFITNTQEKCHFTASVVYDGDQGDSVSPIDVSTITWTLTGQDPSSLKLQTSKKNWSGSHPSKLAGTSFNVVGTISVPAVVRERWVYKDGKPIKKVPDYLTSTSCSHLKDDDRLQRQPRHRGGTYLGFTLVFSAKTEDGQEIKPARLVLKADPIDRVRQEYVDYNRPIPERGDSRMQNQDFYDFGHYELMLNNLLQSNHKKWVDEINKLKGAAVDTFSVSDFVLTSGYRNPHHNFDHAGSTANLSPHMYGYALDLRGTENAAKKPLDIDGDGKNTAADRTVMVTAAKAAGSRPPIVYTRTKHVHADWAPGNWATRTYTSAPADKEFSLPPDGTDTPAVVKPEDKDDDKKPSGNLVLLPSSSSEAKAGESYSVSLTTKSPFASVKFYVKSPGDTGKGTLMETVSGSVLSESASFTYTFPSSASGAYEIIAVVNDFSDSSVYEASVSVSVAAAAPVEKKDGVILECGHEDDGSNDHFKIPYTCCAIEDWWCLNRHGRQECPKDAKNRACIVEGGFMWKCNPHEHKYPSDVVIKPPDPKQVIKKTTDPKQTVFPKDDPPKETQPDPPPDPEVKPDPKEDRKADPVDPKVTGDCGIHAIALSEASKHTSVKHSCGVHSYYACQSPSRAEVSRHTSRTLPCGAHTGYLCTADSSHTISKPCPVSNGVACSYGSYYPCSPHTHAYPETKPQVQYQSCGNHLTTASGDHSYVTSCSVTNSRGDSCTNPSGYYACSVHVHSFPDPPPPPDPPVVICANSSTGPGACIYHRMVSSSDAYEHRVTCREGHRDWTCNVNANKWHKARTCSRCGNTYTGCTNSSVACRSTQWHTETLNPWVKGSSCKHTFRKSTWDRHEVFYKYKRSGCNVSTTKCQNAPNACVRPGKPDNWHWL